MPNLVSTAFFVRDINLPNTTDTKIAERLNSLITMYEQECLLNILGYPLYKLFGVESSARMTALLSGAEYTDAVGQLRKWKGLVHNTDQSLIAYYIYYHVLRLDATQTTGTGQALMKKSEAKPVSPAIKMIDAWKVFSDQTAIMAAFLWLAKTGDTRIYPEFGYYQYIETLAFSRSINEFGI